MKGVCHTMMAPKQTIEEVELFLENLDFDGFNIQDLLDLMDVLDKEKAIVGHKIQTAHSAS